MEPATDVKGMQNHRIGELERKFDILNLAVLALVANSNRSNSEALEGLFSRLPALDSARRLSGAVQDRQGDDDLSVAVAELCALLPARLAT